VDLVTNKRTVATNVLIEDGGIIVIGGLINSNSQRQESRVPILGSIPIIGLAFKTRSASIEKDNLMIFLRPKIMRDAAQAAYETDLKYNYMQDQQRNFEHREIPPLLPGEHAPRLPALPPSSAPAGSGPQSPEDQARQAEQRRDAEDAVERQRTRTAPRQPLVPTAPPQSNTPPGEPAPDNTAAPAPANPQQQPPQDGGHR
jgi:general secretion pathway protein D